MMAATFVQMISFMMYKIFFQERLEDQTYVQTLMTQSRRSMKKMNAELQRFQMSLEMEGQRRMMESAMEDQKSKLEGETGQELTNIPLIGLDNMR